MLFYYSPVMVGTCTYSYIPISMVTRSMKAKKEAIKEQGKEEIGLVGTFLPNCPI